jgi:hypothetical protein
LFVYWIDVSRRTFWREHSQAFSCLAIIAPASMYAAAAVARPAANCEVNNRFERLWVLHVAHC